MLKYLTLILLVFVVAVVGCSGGPSIEPPKFNASKITDKAMELYDSDSDGALTKDELAAAPGLLDGMFTIDADKDNKLTSDEILARFEALDSSNSAGQNATLQFRNAFGKPVAGASVTLEPEAFLEGVVVEATGKTDFQGMTEPKCSAIPYGMQPGFYRVRVSKIENGKEQIKAEFNSSTELGVEISGGTRGAERGSYQFDLK